MNTPIQGRRAGSQTIVTVWGTQSIRTILGTSVCLEELRAWMDSTYSQ